MNDETHNLLPESATRIILESISDGVFTVDHGWRITFFNRAAEAITGVSRKEAVGKPCCDVFRADTCEKDCALRRTMDTGEAMVERQAFIVRADGEQIPVSLSTALLRDRNGNIIGGVETFRDLSLVEELRRELEGRFQAGDMVSASPSMRRIFDMIPAVAGSESTVLIQGETGTGKEVLARAIHYESRRREGPFIAVNCGALPDTLLESELFGYRKGAFTGAETDKPGRFALAEGGTLFLDEIGEISPAVQVRLLRVLQEKCYEPLGATESVHADTRILCATHRDLDAEIEAGRFRRDLYYRINIVRMELPPLRERREDIPLLIDWFIARFNRIQQKQVAGVSPEVLALLVRHDWPGNIRQLENVIEHAFVLCREGLIRREHLPAELRPAGTEAEEALPPAANTLKDIEARAIREALARNRGNRQQTAKELGIHKTTLFRKMKALGIPFPEKDGRNG
jgi:PAS domain S-box-containing protein